MELQKLKFNSLTTMKGETSLLSLEDKLNVKGGGLWGQWPPLTLALLNNVFWIEQKSLFVSMFVLKKFYKVRKSIISEVGRSDGTNYGIDVCDFGK